MKTLLSLFIFPLLIISVSSFLLAGFFQHFVGSELALEDTITGHAFSGLIWFSMFAGLLLAVASALGGIVLIILSFILKSWSRAILSAGACALGFYIWLYFLSVEM